MLKWESLNTEEPGDQVASGQPGVRYEIGPHDSTDWTVTVIDRDGEYMLAADLLDEVAAKATAQRHYDRRS